MKNKNLMMGLGFAAAMSAQAQTTIVNLGFEDSDNKYTTEGALTPGGTFGDWVNKNEYDVWNEKSKKEVHSGEYSLQMDNDDSYFGNTWDRGFKIGNLTLKENTPYRVSFWIKAEENEYTNADNNLVTCGLSSYLSMGIENYDLSMQDYSGTAYGFASATFFTEGWQHVSYISYFTNAAHQDSIAATRDWIGNAVYPEKFGGDGEKTYAKYFESKMPRTFFIAINPYCPGTYYIDDIKLEEGVTFNEATFYLNAIKLDFGYGTNIKELATANGGTLSLDPSCAKVTVDGKDAEVEYVEGKEDGFLYVFLKDDVDDKAEVKVSFTPSADCPVKYTDRRLPSAERTSDMTVLAFANETAYLNESIDVTSMAWAPAQLVKSTPDNESFDLESLASVTLDFDKKIDVEYASAALESNGKTTDLNDNMKVSEDGKSIIVTLPEKLANGEYTLTVSNIANEYGIECAGPQTVTFAIGKSTEITQSEEIYCPDWTNLANGTFPVGWVSNDNGTIHEYGLTENGEVWNYNWGGNVGGGGCRSMTGYSGDFKGGAMYWRSMNDANTLGTLTFGEQVKDFILANGSISPDMDPNIALHLEARKYQISFKMAAWKFLGDAAPKYNFELTDLEGNVYASFTDFEAKPNVNGNQNMEVKGATNNVADFTVPEEGYYILKFSTTVPNAELLMGNLRLITMPSKSSYYKGLLSNAIDEATIAYTENGTEEYECATGNALLAEINAADKAIKESLYHSGAEIEAEINKLTELSNALIARKNNITMFEDNIMAAVSAVEGLEGSKYVNAADAPQLIATINSYKETDPKTLDDATLATVAPNVKAAAEKLANLKTCTDLLTWGIYKATETYDKIGANDQSARDAASNALADDRDVAAGINLANKLRVLQILAEAKDGKIAEEYLTKVNEREDVDENDNLITVCDAEGIELTGAVQNPKFYRVLGNDGVPGWTITAGSDSTSLNIAYNTGASEAKPVEDTQIQIYGNADYDFSQTIENLPAGIYTIQISTRTPRVDKTAEFDKIFEYNAQNDETKEWDKYIYAQGSGDKVVTPYTPASGLTATYISNVEVRDGKLTIGAHEHYVSGKAEKHEDNTPQDFWTGTTYVDDVHVYLVAPLADYDYAKAADEFATAIESLPAADAVVTDIFSTSGVRQNALQKGINIMKYSDGSVRKVMVK